MRYQRDDMPQVRGRDQEIDFIKGMLIWCVVYGHAVDALCGRLPHQSVWLHVFVRTFDLPFFMVISGYFCQKSLGRKNLSRVVIDRLTMLLFPIVIWTLLRGHLNIVSGMYYFLWAVLSSTMACVAVRLVTRLCRVESVRIMELVFLWFLVVLLYFIHMPWNLFYLFPFFVVGYGLRDLDFRLTKTSFATMVIVFAVGLCFWSAAYSPWRLNDLAWRTDSFAVILYAYRTVLAIAGVYVMNFVFRAVMGYLSRTPLVKSAIVEAGAETLAIYILQAILVERAIGKLLSVVFGRLGISVADWYVNLVGYVIAPIVAFFVLIVLTRIVRKIKMIPVVRNLFGFKFKVG